jgi:hypothetical protein
MLLLMVATGWNIRDLDPSGHSLCNVAQINRVPFDHPPLTKQRQRF